MEIISNIKRWAFEEVNPGDVFVYNDKYYIKTGRWEKDDEQAYAVNLQGGEVIRFTGTEIVWVCDSELYIG